MADNSNPQRRSKRSRRDDPKMIGAWKLGKTIGKGSSGRVKIARHTGTGEYAAVKIVSKQALITSRMSMTGMSEQADKVLLSIEREIVLMKLIDHPNVLSLYDVWETSNELYLILEYVQNGELFDHLVAKGRLSMQEALMYFQQIISAVDYCHRFKIAHRDLKPENLLLDRDNNIKVADFGMAAWEGCMDMLETSCGSPHYASPEVVQGKAYKGFTSDIWSCGVILYALLVGRLPFDDENIRTLLDKVKRAKFVMPTDIPLSAQDLIARMLQKDVDKRITMSQILVHPWFTCLPPKPLRQPVVAPPSLETLHRPVETGNDIDSDILTNLRTLWHGAPDEQIIAGLLNEESTWEKAVYTLLLQYRVRRLENYNDEEGRPIPQARQRLILAVEKPLPAEPVQALLSNDAWNDTQATLQIEKKSSQSVPSRPNQPAGPRAPPSKIAALDPSTSQIHSIRMVQDPSSDDSSSQRNAPASPQLPPIAVPELGGHSIEKFFSQPGDHIKSNQHEVSHSSNTKTENQQQTVEDDGRFADADDDMSGSCDAASLHGSTATSRTAATQSSGEASPGIPLLGHKGSSIHYRRYTIHAPTPTMATPAVIPGKFGLGQPPPSHRLLEQRSVRGMHIPPSLVLPPPAPLRLNTKTVGRPEGISSDKENTSSPGALRRQRAGTIGSKPAKESAESSFLERRRTLGDRRVQIVLPGEVTKFSKQSHPMVTNSSNSSSGSSSTSGEKITWFGNLFRFKPATFHLLSVYDHVTSREACKRLLVSMGVLVSMENSGCLSCRFEEVTDPSGVMESVKAIWFRVEVHGVLHPHAVAGFTCSLSLIQEKGALSSFKLVYNRLRREWQLDAPTSILKTTRNALSSAMNARRSYDL